MKSSVLFFVGMLAVLTSTGQSSKWQDFEGWYRNPDNGDMVWQFVARDTGLAGRALWANREFHLLPDSGLAFVSREEVERGQHLHVAFQRESSGAVSGVSLNGGKMWARVVNFTPKPPKQEIAHTAEQLQQFVGLYQLKADSTRYAELRINDDGLKLYDHMDEGTLGLFVPDSAMTFFIKQAPFITLKFSQDGGGRVTQFKAFNGQVWIKTVKPDLSLTQLRSYEGKFRSVDDPDNVIQLIAGDSELVVSELWSKKDMRLRPLTNTYFNDAKLLFPLQIISENGQVKQVVVLGNETFEKIAGQDRSRQEPERIKEEIAHTPDQLQKFTGLYQVMPDSSEYIEVTVEDNSLTLHWVLDNGMQKGFVPSAEGKFFRKDYPVFTLDFSEDQQGHVTQFVAVGRLRYIKLAKTAPSPAQLKTYEGKFRSTDDPDNIVQLIADGGDLVVTELWNKKEIRLQPVTTTYFNDGKYSFSLRVFSENGRVKKLVLLGNETFERLDR